MVRVEILFLLIMIVTMYMLILFLFLEKSPEIKRKKRNVLEKISFIIPVYNGGEFIGDTIKSIKDVDYPDNLKEIIVVDDGSTDKSAEIARKMKVKVYSFKHKGKGHAMNQGIKLAKNDYIAFVDDDVYLDKKSIKNLMNHFDDETDIVISNIKIKNPKQSILCKMQDIEYKNMFFIKKNLQKLNAIYVTPGALTVYKRQVFKDVGNFDNKIVTEDIEMGYKALSKNKKIKLAYDAIVRTVVPHNIGGLKRQRLRWYIGAIQTVLKYKSYFFKRKGNILRKVVLPLASWVYISSFLGVIILIRNVYVTALPLILAYANTITSNINPILIDITGEVTIPISLIVFSLVNILIMIYYIRLVHKANGYELSIIGTIRVFLLMSVYILILQIILLYSYIKYIIGYRKW